MVLSQLLKGLDYKVNKGSLDLNINTVQYNSQKVTPGDIFVCIEGFSADGHDYALKAIANGAIAIICKKNLDIDDNITVIKVNDTRKALAITSANALKNPVNDIKLIGVTGTNGKTTSAFMIKSILEKSGYKTGLIGTIANYIGNSKIKAERTTPESLELHKLFKDMRDAGVKYCVMEVSSHSLALDRVYGIRFSQGVFTNLTQDHLDFHKTFENYYEAKLQLFKNANSSIVNIDDNYGKEIVKDIPSESKVTTYSIEEKGELVAKNILNHSRGVEFDLHYKEEKVHINLCIPGRYNVYNALCSAGACIGEGIPLEAIKLGLEDVVVPGRCEIATKEYDLGFDVVIDYAHTPDGLENILKTAREFTKGRLISVFGCGGDRDRGKRPIMGKLGSELSDIVIITSDNPRTEEPLDIIKDVISEMPRNNYTVVENRKEAIKEAIRTAQKGDVIVVAGKGHEDYQILKDKVIHFDEREVIADVIKELF